ncbi:Acyl-CoA carboxylase epsilon subunit [Micromonospora coxensis]|uniref:Acyl-CoA carboxylase epsilon subunit n=2 Tax=Micromonospora coxensis TaxID=356852 RepID=A0A1C5J5X3_9ACTN|nr:Acyl-CoA carboxylase epsilon subunit [Micromonospora coxensis]
MSRYRSATSWGSASDIAETVPGAANAYTAGTPLCGEGQVRDAYADGMSAEEPLFRVVRGVPTAEELAALVGAIVARSRPVAAPAPAAVSTWARSARPAAATPGVGPGAWRSSGLPR